jgi:hypothetical protein
MKKAPAHAKDSLRMSERDVQRLLQWIGQQHQLGVIVQSLAAIFAYNPYGHVTVGIIRYYTLSLFGGQGMQTQAIFRNLCVLKPSKRHAAMTADIVYSHMYAS